MRSRKFRLRYRASDGFIVIAVLWILAALATLAAVYTLYLHEVVPGVAGRDDRLHAQALELAGVELAVYELTAIPDARPSTGRFGFRLGNADIVVAFRSEAARIDLNKAPKEMLAGLFAEFGANSDDATGFADRIIAWRTPLNAGAADNEASLYAGRTYGPRRAPFQHVNELALVVGPPPALIDAVLPYVTVFSGQPEINVLAAVPEVLAALPRLTPERMQLLLAQREGASQDIVNAQLGTAAQMTTARGSKTNRITVDVRFDADRRFRSEAVVLILDDDAEPYRLLSWRDETVEPSAGERPYAGGR